MSNFFVLLVNFWKSLFGLLDKVVFEINGVDISLGTLVVSFLLVGLVISVFWKGART